MPDSGLLSVPLSSGLRLKLENAVDAVLVRILLSVPLSSGLRLKHKLKDTWNDPSAAFSPLIIGS